MSYFAFVSLCLFGKAFCRFYKLLVSDAQSFPHLCVSSPCARQPQREALVYLLLGISPLSFNMGLT